MLDPIVTYFLRSVTFIRCVMEDDASLRRKWDDWLAVHTDLRVHFNQAEQVLLNLDSMESDFSKEEVAELKKRIASTLKYGK